MEITLQVNRDGFLNLESAQSLGKKKKIEVEKSGLKSTADEEKIKDTSRKLITQ